MILWVLLGLLAAVALLEWWQPRPVGVLAGLIGVAPLVGLAVLPCCAVAVIEQTWLAVAVSGLLGVRSMAVTMPTMHPWPTAAPAAGEWRLTVYSHNVLHTNVDLTEVARQVAKHAPDVVAIEELSNTNVDSLAASSVMAVYPYRAMLTLPDKGGRGLGVWSLLPMTDVEFWPSPGGPQFQATLHPSGQPDVALLVVHAEAPVSRVRTRLWAADLAAIAAKARDSARPTLLVGDFNATPTMRPFRPVRSTGFVDAATATGNGWRRTWPAHQHSPSMMRIDHALHSPDLTTTAYRLDSGAGSDHRAVIVTVAAARDSPRRRWRSLGQPAC